ncbi:glycerol-3-phosphate dehydrogenase/oxidase [Chryseotalea sanaruensis]|uniref:Glycerol-3-phosphate dehydrogenase n=1 Tax=Chryseotalea sanaruensis TaxID=2482724 RepID=A0A401U552_9BACT|nr:glycerol-3-phosphate dehydrogenase [Chryseotalea sanaruensis]GCC50012.1 glycerol-3-phosphate dehydrogenase/oxidase [Chryseotalea sanaruensis]
MSFSLHQRNSILKQAQSENFDLLIIGGGITGVGIALDAASRGLKTVLVEKNDFAYGTSSRSTKLIHGGLRYLKQFEFALVKEVGSERAVVHRLAPHLVLPEKMLLPLREGRGFGSLLTSFGLWLYDWLAGVKQADRRRMLTRKQTLRAEPLLKKDGVKGGGLYAEYRTDDARLTIEIAKTAHQHGAILLTYAQVENFIYTDGRVEGVQVNDLHTNATLSIKAKVVVNATGPWVDTLRTLDGSKQGKTLHLTKGVHIVVAYQRFPIKQAVYFDVADGRMIFAIPRGRTTYIGTTDTDYNADIDAVGVTKADVDYLLNAVNESFPNVMLSERDVESSWAGLRPLIHEEGKSASELSRKDEIFEAASGLLSIAGGKLTGYRKMAERVVDLLQKKYFADRKLKPCQTEQLKLTGADFKSMRKLRLYLRTMRKDFQQINLSPYYADYCVHLYGKQSDEILKNTKHIINQGKNSEQSLLQAELDFTIQHELVISASDFFVRRTGMLFFDMDRVLQYKDWVLTYLKDQFNWNTEEFEQETASLNKLIADANHFH